MSNKIRTLNEKDIAKTPFSRIIISKACTEHSHAFFEFVICTSGKFKNFVNGECYELVRGDILLLRPTDKHSFTAEQKHAARDVYAAPSVLKAVCDSIDRAIYPVLSKESMSLHFHVDDFKLQMLENKLNYFNNSSTKTEIQLKARHRSVILDIIDMWQESKSDSVVVDMPEWISILINQLGTERFLNKNIEEIAAATNYSHGYVCREFKKYMGKTLQEYLSEARFSYSLSLLTSSDLSVTQIAEKLGYNATSNFIIAFKNKFGITPAQWRKIKDNALC